MVKFGSSSKLYRKPNIKELKATPIARLKSATKRYYKSNTAENVTLKYPRRLSLKDRLFMPRKAVKAKKVAPTLLGKPGNRNKVGCITLEDNLSSQSTIKVTEKKVMKWETVITKKIKCEESRGAKYKRGTKLESDKGALGVSPTCMGKLTVLTHQHFTQW